MNGSLLKKYGLVSHQYPVRNVCAKFKDNNLSHFGTGAREVVATQEPFPSKTPATIKTAISNSL